jgi:hypothetical protein
MIIIRTRFRQRLTLTLGCSRAKESVPGRVSCVRAAQVAEGE